MSLGTVFYWAVFGLVVVIWLVWAYAVFFGGVGYTRNSTESTPTGEDGRH